MSRPFRIGAFSASPDDSGERDGWWLRIGTDAAYTETFLAPRDIAKLRRLVERVEKYERRRPKRRAA